MLAWGSHTVPKPSRLSFFRVSVGVMKKFISTSQGSAPTGREQLRNHIVFSTFNRSFLTVAEPRGVLRELAGLFFKRVFGTAEGLGMKR